MTAADLLLQARAKWFPWNLSARARRFAAWFGLVWLTMMAWAFWASLGIQAGYDGAMAGRGPPPVMDWQMVASLGLNMLLGLLLVLQMPVKPCPCCGLPRKGHPEPKA